MALIELTVDNLRCLRHAELELHQGRNLIHGANGSGKTSLLEAAYLLGRGRSFRTRNSEKLITHGEHRLVAFGRVRSGAQSSAPRHAGTPPSSAQAPVSGRLDGEQLLPLGIQVVRGEPTVAKIGGSFVQSLAELSQALPVQVIEPGVHKLVEDGGFRRRRWMDWAVFHVEQGFIDTWSGYARALKQRNSALRHDPRQVGAWDAELARLGESLSASRRRMLEALQPHWSPMIRELTGLSLELSYAQGWMKDLSLAEALEAGKDRDRVRGQTQVGPHRGDALIRLDGRLAREFLSRGQQKLVAVALILSQLKLLQEAVGLQPLLLLDDPAAELDPERLGAFIIQIASLRAQLLLSSLNADAGPFGHPDRVFHVEQGRVTRV